MIRSVMVLTVSKATSLAFLQSNLLTNRQRRCKRRWRGESWLAGCKVWGTWWVMWTAFSACLFIHYGLRFFYSRVCALMSVSSWPEGGQYKRAAFLALNYFDFDYATSPKQPWRRKLNSHANLLKEFSITFRKAIKMVKVAAPQEVLEAEFRQWQIISGVCDGCPVMANQFFNQEKPFNKSIGRLSRGEFLQ
ncbi:hypothetical protein ABKV19_001053 [Rosa sericea]